jgi:hypothetical protein
MTSTNTIYRRPRHTRTGIQLPRTDLRRTVTARRLRSLIAAYEAELGGTLTEQDKTLIRQACTMQLAIEELERKIVEGREVDADAIIRLSSEHRRLQSALRSREVKAKAAGPTNLAELLAQEESGADA